MVDEHWVHSSGLEVKMLVNDNMKDGTLVGTVTM
jgi:hypothetical protein